MYWQAHPARDRRWFDSTYVTSGFRTVYNGDKIMCDCIEYDEYEVVDVVLTSTDKVTLLFALLFLFGIIVVVTSPSGD